MSNATKESNMVTYRRVSHCMGGWKWGYPRGQRNAIVRYVVRDGRWRSSAEVCDGITASNEAAMRREYPQAFENPVGSIHNKAVCHG